MKSNGRSRGREFRLLFSMENSARALPQPARLGLWAWLHSWLRRPCRTFWRLDPTTGEWRRLP